MLIVKSYNIETALVAQFTFTNHQIVETNYFKIENGEEIPCPTPENHDKYCMSLDLDNLDKQFVLEVKDSGAIISTLNKMEKMNVVDEVDLMIPSIDVPKWKEVTSPIEKLSPKEQATLKSTLLHSDQASHLPQVITADLIAQTIENILAEKKSLPSLLFKNISSTDEFGVERFILDRVYYLPHLIEEIQLSHLNGTKYIAQSEQKDSSGNSIRFEYRFQATSEDEARKLFNTMVMNQTGIWQKIWLACWFLGNKKRKFSYSCSLTELMYTTYPNRKSYFSISDKVEFYEHVKSIEQTCFIFSKPLKKSQKTKAKIISYKIPLIQITEETRKTSKEKYPEQITISLRPFEPEPQDEKIYHVGAAIKNKTLDLHADDVFLAEWIQIRKGQRQGHNFITLDREHLMKLSGLQKTNASNKSVANKQLTNKLKRLYEEGILKDYPFKIQDTVRLRIR